MMNERLNVLRDGEYVLWSGRADEHFPILEKASRLELFGKWLILPILTIVLEWMIVVRNEIIRWNILIAIALLALLIMWTVFYRIRKIKKQRYYITNSRILVILSEYEIYTMEDSDIDGFCVEKELTKYPTIVIGHVLYPEIHKQLRWRAANQMKLLLSDEGAMETTPMQGLILYDVKDTENAVKALCTLTGKSAD